MRVHQATGTPAAPRALSLLLNIVMNNAARVPGRGKALFSSVREAIGNLQQVWKPRKGQEKKSLFPESATVVATTAQGASKKKCISNALGYTLVVVEVL